MAEEANPTFEDFGLKEGIVVDDLDSEKAGHVLVRVPDYFEPHVRAQCIMPGSPFSRGMYVKPAVGSSVIIGLLDGDYRKPVIFGGVVPPTLEGGARAETDAADLTKMIRIENEDWVVVLGKSETNAPYFSISSRPDENGVSMRFMLDLDQNVAEINVPKREGVANAVISLVTAGLLNLNGRLTQIRNRPVAESTTGEPIA